MTMAKNNNTYTLIYWNDAQWIVGTLKEVRGVISQGKTMDELVDNIIDAYKELRISAEDLIPVNNSKRKKLEILL